MKRLQRIPPKYRKKVEDSLRTMSRGIQERRENLDLTQEELAEDLDISVETMKAIETGRRVPSLEMLLYVCFYLGIAVHFESP